MTTFGTIEGAISKAHVTIDQAIPEFEQYMQKADRLIITRIRLFNDGIFLITNDDFKKSLDDHAEDIAANKWHMENDSDTPHRGYEIAVQEMKDTVKAEFTKQIDGVSHSTFRKTTNKITADTRGIGTSI